MDAKEMLRRADYEPNVVDITPPPIEPAKFKTGDVVQLKSGGPRMTVGEDDKCKVTCWYLSADYKEVHTLVIDENMLNPCEGVESSPAVG